MRSTASSTVIHSASKLLVRMTTGEYASSSSLWMGMAPVATARSTSTDAG